jgi:hypothetical protein
MSNFLLKKQSKIPQPNPIPDHGGTAIPAAWSRHSVQPAAPDHGGGSIPNTITRGGLPAAQSHHLSGPASYGGDRGDGGVRAPGLPSSQPYGGQIPPQSFSHLHSVTGAFQSGVSDQQYSQSAYPQTYLKHNQPSPNYPANQAVRPTSSFFWEIKIDKS